MNKRLIILSSVVVAFVVALALGGAALAFRGGHPEGDDPPDSEKPGALDDGKELAPKAKIKLAEAIAAARQAASGRIGQVDIESDGGPVFYEVDVGDHEVRVDALNGRVVEVESRS